MNESEVSCQKSSAASRSTSTTEGQIDGLSQSRAAVSWNDEPVETLEVCQFNLVYSKLQMHVCLFMNSFLVNMQNQLKTSISKHNRNVSVWIC